MNLHTLMTDLHTQLAPAYPDEHEREQVIWWMLEAITQKPQVFLIAHARDLDLSLNEKNQLNMWIKKQIIDHEPLQYLLGTVPFLDLTIIVEPPILIPRPETEFWTGQIIEKLKPYRHLPLSILDLCSGSGCIGLALAQALPRADVIGVDIHEKAIALAERNKKINKIQNITFLHGDLFTPVTKKQFDLIVANPPYASTAEWNTLDPRVTQWEDKSAIWAPDDGLALIKKIIAGAAHFLKQESPFKETKVEDLYIEIGSLQGKAVKEVYEKYGYSDVSILKDQYERERVVSGILTRKTDYT